MTKVKEANELKEMHVLQIMRNGLRGFEYEPTKDEVRQYQSMFRVSRYSANVYLLILELGKGEKINMPDDMDLRADYFEYLMVIRYFNPFAWQLRERRDKK